MPKIPRWLGDVTGFLSGSTRAKAQERREKLKLRLDQEDRQMDRRPKSMEPVDKKAKYNSKLVFAKGDLGVADDVEMARLFPRKIKNAGKELVSSRALPFHPEKMVGDTPGLSVRHAPKDEVV